MHYIKREAHVIHHLYYKQNIKIKMVRLLELSRKVIVVNIIYFYRREVHLMKKKNLHQREKN